MSSFSNPFLLFLIPMAFYYIVTLLLLLGRFTPSVTSAPTATASAVATTSTSGCSSALPDKQSPGGDSHQVAFTQSNGVKRVYLIHIPSNYDINTPAPLIFSFHGHGKTAAQQEGLSQFSNEGTGYNPNAFAVYPQGLTDSSGGTAWQGDPRLKNVDDIGFVTDMIAHFKDRYCIDPKRIYASGKSNGGGFVGQTMACDPTMSKVIAAFAPVSGANYVPGSTKSNCDPETIAIPCNPSRSPIPLLQFHGNADKTIPYLGGPRNGACLPTVAHWVQEWSSRQNLGLSNTTASLYDNKLMKYEYGSGSQTGVVTHYMTKGLGHWWPSVKPNNDNPAGTFYDATPIIMEFFNKYTL